MQHVVQPVRPEQSNSVTFSVSGKLQTLTNSKLIEMLYSNEYKNDFAKTRTLLRSVAKKVVNGLMKGTFDLTEASLMANDIGAVIKDISKKNVQHARQVADIPNAIRSVIDQKTLERLALVDRNKSLVESSQRLTLDELQKLFGLSLEVRTIEGGTVITDFFRAEVKDSPQSGTISGLRGYGSTLGESLNELIKELSRKVLVLHPRSSMRRNIQLPLITID